MKVFILACDIRHGYESWITKEKILEALKDYDEFPEVIFEVKELV